MHIIDGLCFLAGITGANMPHYRKGDNHSKPPNNEGDGGKSWMKELLIRLSAFAIMGAVSGALSTYVTLSALSTDVKSVKESVVAVKQEFKELNQRVIATQDKLYQHVENHSQRRGR